MLLAALLLSAANEDMIALPSAASLESHGLRPIECEKLVQPPYDLQTSRSALVRGGSRPEH